MGVGGIWMPLYRAHPTFFPPDISISRSLVTICFKHDTSTYLDNKLNIVSPHKIHYINHNQKIGIFDDQFYTIQSKDHIDWIRGYLIRSYLHPLLQTFGSYNTLIYICNYLGDLRFVCNLFYITDYPLALDTVLGFVLIAKYR